MDFMKLFEEVKKNEEIKLINEKKRIKKTKKP